MSKNSKKVKQKNGNSPNGNGQSYTIDFNLGPYPQEKVPIDLIREPQEPRKQEFRFAEAKGSLGHEPIENFTITCPKGISYLTK